MKLTSYRDLEHLSWEDILAENWGGFRPPYTVNLPLQPIHSPDVIHVNGSMTVCRRRAFSGLNHGDTAARNAVQRQAVMKVEFALGDPPAVPDHQRGILKLEGGCLPIAAVSHRTYAVEVPNYALDNGLSFDFTYFCAPTGTVTQNQLWIEGKVTNRAEIPITAHVWAKVNFPAESDIFEFHYIPFYWDATKYPPCDKVSLDGDKILYAGGRIGRIMPGPFEMEWVKSRDFADDRYKLNNYFVRPALRYQRVRDAIHLGIKLQPGQMEGFRLMLYTGFEAVTESEVKALERLDAAGSQEAARRHFESVSTGDATELACAAGRWGEIFSHLRISTSQMLLRFPDQRGLVPTQGSSSERHFVWVWEAVCMLMPMLRIGAFAPVREALDFIFSLQDGGFPPKGRFTSLQGAIGTTGPKWINSTGSALALAAEYVRVSHDEAFARDYLSRILKAMDWIVGEIRATRVLNADGSRPAWYGLMPFGCGTDGDVGYVISFTDAYTYWGLAKAVRMLKDLGHPQADAYRKELEQYRQDIGTAMESLRRQDGFIARRIATGDPGEYFSRGFENVVGVFHLAFCDAVDVAEPMFLGYLRYFEEQMAHGCFAGRVDDDVMYMGVGEWGWQDIYLRLGQWKKAFAATQINLRYGMTPDTHQVQERFSVTDASFCPWQPNGSGNGKVLDMILKSFYYEQGEDAVLLGGIPFAWLRQNKRTLLRNLHTPNGRITLEANMSSPRQCRLELSVTTKGCMPGRIRLPEHFSAVDLGAQPMPQRDGWFECPRESLQQVFLLTEALA